MQNQEELKKQFEEMQKVDAQLKEAVKARNTLETYIANIKNAKVDPNDKKALDKLQKQNTHMDSFMGQLNVRDEEVQRLEVQKLQLKINHAINTKNFSPLKAEHDKLRKELDDAGPKSEGLKERINMLSDALAKKPQEQKEMNVGRHVSFK